MTLKAIVAMDRKLKVENPKALNNPIIHMVVNQVHAARLAMNSFEKGLSVPRPLIASVLGF